MLQKLWSDESAQGATEYILMLVIVVAIAVMFKGKIMALISGKMAELDSSIGGFK